MCSSDLGCAPFGEAKSASSVIETLFFGGGGGSSSTSPYRAYTSTKGVAPVIDLGRYSWLVAVMDYYGTVYSQRKKEFDLSCKDPKNAPRSWIAQCIVARLGSQTSPNFRLNHVFIRCVSTA